MYVCMTSFTLTPRKIESDMQATTTIYNHVCTGRMYHFLDELRASPRPVVAQMPFAIAALMACDFETVGMPLRNPRRRPPS